MRHTGKWQGLQVAVVWMGLLMAPWTARAQSVDPCTGGPGSGAAVEITGGNLEMPVPNTGNDWKHTAGSTAHTGRDLNALDLNENATAPNFDNQLPVLAVGAGTVRFAALTPASCGYGNSVMVEHNVGGNIFYSHYAHLDASMLVALGDVVQQGQVLGYVSQTGNASTPHLHWSVRQGTTPRYTTLNGYSTANANTQGLSFTSDTRMIWLEDFQQSNTWQAAASNAATFSVQAGQMRIAGASGLGLVQHKNPIFVRPDNGPYRLKYAARTERYRANQSAVAGLRLECMGSDRTTVLSTVIFTSVLDTYGGWSVLSFPVTFGSGSGQCPTTTRFVRPILVSSSSVGAAVVVDWVGLEERAPAASAGTEQFNAYTYGGVRRFTYNLGDTAAFSRVEVLGAASRAALSSAPQILCTFPGNASSNFCTQPLNSLQSIPFHALRLWTSAGAFRDLGPVQVDAFTRAYVPGLNNAQLMTLDFQNIPLWASYPFATFDNSIDNYGIVNYAPNAGLMIFTPEAPVTGLKTFRAYYGGNTTRATVRAVDHATGNLVELGSVTSTPLNWVTLTNAAWPATTRAVWVTFERLNYDNYLHVDEVLFSP
ncbi:M23 family metallopeptidase [Corallococcus sicarius]|nr:M23 family metallopeptidase [Corallococcus sicarius]